MFAARPARTLAVVLVTSLLAVVGLRVVDGPASRSGRSAARRATEGAVDRRVAETNVGDRLGAYRGLGTWIDLYDVAWRHPATAVRKMAREGIGTLYLETSNFSRPQPIVFRTGVGRFLDAAHRLGIRVVGWYLPGFRDLGRDRRRSVDAIRFRSTRGNAFDSFALDIESSAVGRARTRTRRLLAISARIRRAVGQDYPLGAIIPSPRVLAKPQTYWPGFPFRALTRTYDVLLPMTYFTYRVSGEAAAQRYTASSISIIRQRTRDPAVPIHVIGGIGASAPETRGFVDAVRDRGAIGASYYTFPVTPARDWRPLRRIGARPGATPTG